MHNILIEISNPHSGFNDNVLSVVSFISIISAIFIVISKNPIISVLYLILLFASIATYLFFTGIIFIGLSYLLVYVGAVSILFLFILMLINIRVSELIGDTNNNIPLALLSLLAFFIPVSDILPNVTSKSEQNTLSFLTYQPDSPVYYVSSNNWDGYLLDISDITCIGNIMYSSYFIWLIITSIILLLAMVGSIVITIKQNNIIAA